MEYPGVYLNTDREADCECPLYISAIWLTHKESCSQVMFFLRIATQDRFRSSPHPPKQLPEEPQKCLP